jgi:protein TonB
MISETQNRSIALTVSISLHAILFLILFFFILKTPNPPFGGGQGVVLNLGYVDEGTGEVQTLNEPNDSPINEENKPSEQNNTAVPEDPKDKVEPDKPAETKENLVSTDEESEVKTEPIPKPKEEPVEKVKSKEPIKEEVKKEEKKTEVKEESKKPKELNSNALYGQNGTSTKGGNNNGDKEGKVGDQGNPNGDINAKALYGNAGKGGDGQGGSGGSSLDLAGWRWDRIPRVKDDNEDENGKIVFQITIDDQGEIIAIKTLEKTISPSVEKLYREAVEKLSFTKTDNKIPASTSTGKITFIIKSK